MYRILVVSGLGLWNYGPRWEVFSRFVRSGYQVHYASPSVRRRIKEYSHIKSVSHSAR